MKFLEKNLEDIIFETDNELLRQRGLYIHGNKIRQLHIGNYGVCDLITWYKENLWHHITDEPFLNIDIFELKQGQINTDTFMQAMRYCKGISSYIQARKPFLKVRIDVNLVGSQIAILDDFVYLPEILLISSENDYELNGLLKLYTYEYRFDGIYFNEEIGYKLSDEGFNIGGKNNGK